MLELELVRLLALELVLEQPLELELVLEQLLGLELVLQQLQQSRHRSLEQQSLVSRRCHASTVNRHRFSTANCQRCCASCRCWWLNRWRKLNLR